MTGENRFDRYNSKNKPGDSWFDKYKSGLTKSGSGGFIENYSRNKDLTNSFTKPIIDISRYSSHRPDNIHYLQKPISRNEISGSSGQVVEDNLGELVSDFDRKIDRTKPSDIYTKVDEAIALAEKLEKSQASKEAQVKIQKSLI